MLAKVQRIVRVILICYHLTFIFDGSSIFVLRKIKISLIGITKSSSLLIESYQVV